MEQTEAAQIQERIESWLNGPYDSSVKEEIRTLQEKNPQALIDAFYRDLSFGTGGMRSLMGVGTNRMNVYTVRAATQGLADVLLEEAGPKKVFIGYDVRINSRLFAEETARVLAGNGIEVYLTSEICPTPLVSFGCRYYGCSAAVMITASHNPPEYNGYKVYWSDGGQVVYPNDSRIIEKVKKIKSPDQVRLSSLNDPKIQWVGEEIDEAYLKELDRLRLYTPQVSLRLIYSNLHGTGLRLVPKALARRGFSKDLHLVEEQKSLDGNFPNAPVPNPEEEKAFTLGGKQLLREEADLLLVTDPDADRIGAAIRHQGCMVRFNGHELTCLLLAHIATAEPLPPKSAFIKTIVTTEMAAKIAESFGLKCFNVLTGFKNIANLIHQWERTRSQVFLFGAEESQGYLFKSFVRDKDGISAACLVAEMAERAKSEGCTLLDRLYALYEQYGVYRQRLDSFSFADTPVNREKMKKMMASLRANPPKRFSHRRVERLDDYLLAKESSDVLHFWLEEGGKLIIRPSGTEPKIKIYSEVCDRSEKSIEERISFCDEQLRQIVDEFKMVIK